MTTQGFNPPKTFVCKGCKKEFKRIWYPSRKLPQYCTSSCRKSHRITVICEICSKTFKVPPSREHRKYCSKKCKHKGTERKNKICKWCKKSYKPTSYMNQGYCCLQCFADAKKATRLQKICEICGKEFEVRKGYGHARFCSLKCSAIGIAKRGPDSPSWQGGCIRYRGPNWNQQARKTRKRDNYTCQICNLYQKKPALCAHHIVPFRHFNGDYKTANKLSNLITLCPKCHASVENADRPRNKNGQLNPW